MITLTISGRRDEGGGVFIKPSYRNKSVITTGVNKIKGLLRIMMMITEMRRTIFLELLALIFSLILIYLHNRNNIIKSINNKTKSTVYPLLRFYDDFMTLCIEQKNIINGGGV